MMLYFPKKFYSLETLLLAIYCVLASSLKMSRFLHDRSNFFTAQLNCFSKDTIKLADIPFNRIAA